MTVIVLEWLIGLQYRECVTNMSCHNEKENKNSIRSSVEASYYLHKFPINILVETNFYEPHLRNLACEMQ